MAQDVFYEVIVPLLEMVRTRDVCLFPLTPFLANPVYALSQDRTALLCISTPQDSLNFYSGMMEMKHPNTGLPLFRTIKVGLACDACIAAGKPEKCTHQGSLVPEWKSSSKHSMIKALYDMAGKGEMMQVRLCSRGTVCCAILTLACAFFRLRFSGSARAWVWLQKTSRPVLTWP